MTEIKSMKDTKYVSKYDTLLVKNRVANKGVNETAGVVGIIKCHHIDYRRSLVVVMLKFEVKFVYSLPAPKKSYWLFVEGTRPMLTSGLAKICHPCSTVY